MSTVSVPRGPCRELGIQLALCACPSDSFSFLPRQIPSPVLWIPSLRPPCSCPPRSRALPRPHCPLPLPPASPRPSPRGPRCCPRCCRRPPPPLLPPRPPALVPLDAQASTLSSSPPPTEPRAWATGCPAAPRPPLPVSVGMRGRGPHPPRILEQQVGTRAPRPPEPPHRSAPGLPRPLAWKPASGTSWWSCGP